MRVLGIDVGFTTANPTSLALLDTETGKVSYVVHLSSGLKDWQARCQAIWQGAACYLKRAPVDLVAIEAAHFTKNHQTALRLAYLSGALAAIAAGQGIPAVLVQPAQSKLALAGKGNATKEDMVAAAGAYQADGITMPDSHSADALGAALAGWRRYGESQSGHTNTQRPTKGDRQAGTAGAKRQRPAGRRRGAPRGAAAPLPGA